jgi:hypothetical protein
MIYLIAKAAISGILVLIISEMVRLRPGIGGLIASIPVVSVLSFIWAWQETAENDRWCESANVPRGRILNSAA